MRTTNERLNGVYCRPQTDVDWVKIGFLCRPSTVPSDNEKVCFVATIEGGFEHRTLKEVSGKSEMPTERISDLVHDRIVPWRLWEDGFVQQPFGALFSKNIRNIEVSVSDSGRVGVTLYDGYNSADSVFSGIKTYTQLLNLIEMMG